MKRGKENRSSRQRPELEAYSDKIIPVLLRKVNNGRGQLFITNFASKDTSLYKHNSRSLSISHSHSHRHKKKTNGDERSEFILQKELEQR